MMLRHVLLAVLTAAPMTGYDLVKYFDRTVALLWHAPHSQIYPELRRMERADLVEADEIRRGKRGTKRRYRISEAGVIELRAWAENVLPLQPERNVHRLKAAFFEWSSYDCARRQLTEHRDHYVKYLRHSEQEIIDIENVRIPLLRKRIEALPKLEVDAIVAFKRFAFRGEAARAKAEIAWAEEGLRLLDDLEESGAALAQRSDP